MHVSDTEVKALLDSHRLQLELANIKSVVYFKKIHLFFRHHAVAQFYNAFYYSM